MAIYNVVGVGQKKKYFDEGSYQSVISYILTPGKAIYAGGANISSLSTAADEMLKVAIQFGKNYGKRVRHSVLSFANYECITPEMANCFAQEIIQHYAPDYQIVYAVHADSDNVHIHFVMNQVSFSDGHKYGGKLCDYRAFENHMRNVTRRPIIMSKEKDFAA